MKWQELSEQQCAVARFLAVLGDRWSLLILTDCFLGSQRFETFKSRLQISRTMLSERLKKLCDHEILEKVEYKTKPSRYCYQLTAKGLDLYPVIMTMSTWSNQHYSAKDGPPILTKHLNCDHDFTAQLSCSHCNEPVQPSQVETRARTKGKGKPLVIRGPLKKDRD